MEKRSHDPGQKDLLGINSTFFHGVRLVASDAVNAIILEVLDSLMEYSLVDQPVSRFNVFS